MLDLWKPLLQSIVRIIIIIFFFIFVFMRCREGEKIIFLCVVLTVKLRGDDDDVLGL